jgi:PBP1b-binding outer membrane lipoprotein LpoB
VDDHRLAVDVGERLAGKARRRHPGRHQNDRVEGRDHGNGIAQKSAAPPAILAVSVVRNETGKQFDTDLLTKKIRVKLNNSGKALTTTTVGLGGQAEDPLARGIQEEQQFLEDKKVTKTPDFSLSGKIIETRAKAGNVRQSTFSFQLSLTDKRGLALWEGEEEITKQGKRPSVGF